jgi:hypothetical protein
MAFSVVEGEGRTYWCATDGSSTYYVGQLVAATAASKAQIDGTCVPLAVPAGIADTSNFQLILGVVVGLNRRTPQYSTAYQAEYDTGVTTQAAQLARDYTGAEGMYNKNDPQVLVQITEITPYSIIRGNIFNGALGTAPTVVSDTVGTDSTGYTTAGTTTACDFTPVAGLGTIYCRTGNNQGLYRVTKDTSTTGPQTNTAFPYVVGKGDTFVRVPLRQGFSDIYIAGPGLFVDCSNNASTTSFQVFVYELKLQDAGRETVDFRFTADHFCFARA